MQIKTTLRYHLTPRRLPNMTAGESGECWRGSAKIGTLMYCWWSCELIQPFWRAIWNYAQRAIRECLSFDPAIPLPCLFPKEVIDKTTCTKIFIAAHCGGKKLENEGMPFNWGMAEQIVVYVGDGDTSALKGITNWQNSM